MSDLYNDPNFRRDMEKKFEPVWLWAGLGAMAIVVGIFVMLDIFGGPQSQTATNPPTIETTGSGGSSPR
jgi:bacteriorhodopsin